MCISCRVVVQRGESPAYYSTAAFLPRRVVGMQETYTSLMMLICMDMRLSLELTTIQYIRYEAGFLNTRLIFI